MAPHLANIQIPQLRVSNFDVLSNWDLDVVGRTFSAKVPGYLPTTTFLTTLRSNLQLSATGTCSSLPASTISTPTTTAFHPRSTLPGPSPLSISTLASAAIPTAMSLSAPSSKENDAIPDLSYVVAAPDSDDRTEGLKLVADSVAQQRQKASKTVILHPVTLSIAIAIVGILSQYQALATLLTTSCGVLMAGMVTVRWYTAAYIVMAEKIGFKWLESYARESGSNSGSPSSGNGSREPVVLVAKWGDEVIGALVMRVVKRERKGYVKAWTVKLRYRNKGVGRGLLEEGAKIVWGRGGRGMVFEDQHANSGRVLPDFLNGTFDRREARARETLVEVVAETRRERSSR